MKKISNELKSKIIAHEKLKEEEVKDFLEYVIYKGKVIAEHLPKKYEHAWINLIGEICYAYGLFVISLKTCNGIILSLDQKEYLIHTEHTKNDLPALKEHHYMELTDEIRKKYKL